MKQKLCVLHVCALALALSACTQAGEMTEIGAATGGVVGAGLGAIVGSQTGSAGAGLAIGAVAGAGAGAAVGNVLEAQDQAIRQQDEAIERQEQVIRAQRGEIDELRKLGQDSVRFRSKPGYRADTTALKPGQPRANLNTSGAHRNALQAVTASRVSSNSLHVANSARPATIEAPRNSQPGSSTFVGRAAPAAARQVEVKKKELIPEISAKPAQSSDVTGIASLEESGAPEIAVKDSLNEDIAIENNNQQESVARVAPVKPEANSADCLSAEGEFQQATAKNETPDKLFHLRRALRLCPDEPRFHSSLGDVYQVLGRQSDAQFEYQEALKLSPGNPEVKEKLGSLGSSSKEQY